MTSWKRSLKKSGAICTTEVTQHCTDAIKPKKVCEGHAFKVMNLDLWTYVKKQIVYI